MLTISGVSKTYANGVAALRDVNLSIGAGLFGLLGPNGAGKSTLMRTIATLQAPDSGSITFDGADLVADPDVVRGRLGYLPQQFGVYPRIPAADLLDHLAVLKGVANRRERAEQIEAVLALTNLRDVRKRAVSTFSGGMRQRFGIAQALLGDPRLIIVDEPTAGLDPEERNRFHDLLAQVGEKAIVILSTHIVEDVSDLCPRMAVLAGGRLLLDGRPSALIDALRGRVWGKSVPRPSVAAYRETLRVISTRLSAGETQIHVLAGERPEDGFEPVEPDLEDVYFAALSSQENAAC
jgi:ABC-2 type transport system ATP-binding protein